VRTEECARWVYIAGTLGCALRCFS
jgi:hypothetical protein